MSSPGSVPRTGSVLLAIAIVACAATRTSAQNSDGSVSRGSIVDPAAIEEVSNRLEALHDEYEWAAERVSSRKDAEEARQREYFDGLLDTLLVGPFRVVARSTDIGLAGNLAEAGWRRFGVHHRGAEPPDGFEPFTLVMRQGRDSVYNVMEPPYDLFSPDEWGASRYRWQPRSETDIARLLHQATPESLRSWATGTPLHPAFRWDRAARALILTPSPLGQFCVDGSIEACMDLLGLPDLPVPHNRDDGTFQQELSQWMVTQRARLHRVFPGASLRRFGASRFRDDCGPGSTADACMRRMSQPTYKALLWPLEVPARDALVRTALEMGGDQAIYRLARLPESASLDLALETVADAPVREVVAAWRARLVTEDASRRELPKPGGPLLWTAALGLLALTSTRWRA